MNRHPEIQLSRLRQIGWDHWDPIGIRSFGTDASKESAADEYEGYLLQVVSRLNRGKPTEAVVEAILDYLNILPDGPLSIR